VTFNSCKDLSLSVVNRYFTGMIQSGSWGLFTDAAKMNIGLFYTLLKYMYYLEVNILS